MANPRAEILKKVFAEGTKAVRRRAGEVTRIPKGGLENVTEKDLEYLFKGRKDKLYRFDSKPEELLEQGFNLERDPNNFANSEKMVHGLYFAKDPALIRDLFGSRYKPDVEAFLNPSAKLETRIGWQDYNRQPKEGLDALERSLFGDLDEVTVLKPGNTLAKIKTGEGWKYRILSILGALSQLKQEADERQ